MPGLDAFDEMREGDAARGPRDQMVVTYHAEPGSESATTPTNLTVSGHESVPPGENHLASLIDP
ncbi:hypothetical protein ACFFS4_24095 [Kutzneria kofuensis]|uniref:Uncharacterized protein n=1 Tax=Kutzneria kofuensis TaxID=103725 RepID=A0A7W9KPA5_9PSEU|nr:hypothetical protein [Kutzneria kofuensis]MBB5896222.1 hypothetical protein [Kutzneria kofuensis]